MSDLADRPAYRLHTLVDRLDASADAFLRSGFDISFPRYLVLTVVARLGAPTQRELAAAQGVSEPATSRMVAALVASGQLQSTATPGGGNRRAVTLTDAGTELLARATDLLEDAFSDLAAAAEVDPALLLELTNRLLLALDPDSETT